MSTEIRGRNSKCPVFPSVPTESRLHSPPPPCPGNECVVVWRSLLSDIRKGDSLGLSQEGREIAFSSPCPQLGYTEVNSKESHKVVKIITGQLRAQQLCGTRDPEDGPLCCGKTALLTIWCHGRPVVETSGWLLFGELSQPRVCGSSQ